MSEERPCRKAAREQDLWDEMLVYVPDTDVALALNSSARAVWELCDGTRTVTEISQVLGECCGCPAQAIHADVESAVSQFREFGLILREGASHASMLA